MPAVPAAARERRDDRPSAPDTAEVASRFRAETTNARRDSARALIVTNAAALFEEQDFDGVSVEDMARASGISVRTFYRYFSTRDEVLIEFGLRGAARIPAQLAGRPADEPPLQALILAIAERDADALEHSRRWNAIVARLGPRHADVLATVASRLRDLLLPELRKRLSPESVAAGDDVLLSGLASSIVASIPEHEGRAHSPGQAPILLAAARARAAFLAIDDRVFPDPLHSHTEG